MEGKIIPDSGDEVTQIEILDDPLDLIPDDSSELSESLQDTESIPDIPIDFAELSKSTSLTDLVEPEECEVLIESGRTSAPPMLEVSSALTQHVEEIPMSVGDYFYSIALRMSEIVGRMADSFGDETRESVTPNIRQYPTLNKVCLDSICEQKLIKLIDYLERIALNWETCTEYALELAKIDDEEWDHSQHPECINYMRYVEIEIKKQRIFQKFYEFEVEVDLLAFRVANID